MYPDQKKNVPHEAEKERGNTMMKRELKVEELELVVGGGVDPTHVTSCKDYDLSNGLPLHIEIGIVISAYLKKFIG